MGWPLLQRFLGLILLTCWEKGAKRERVDVSRTLRIFSLALPFSRRVLRRWVFRLFYIFLTRSVFSSIQTFFLPSCYVEHVGLVSDGEIPFCLSNATRSERTKRNEIRRPLV